LTLHADFAHNTHYELLDFIFSVEGVEVSG
jgi:hypothetical protein